MKWTFVAAALALAPAAQAQDGLQRTELTRKALTAEPAYEVVLSRLVLMPGGRIPLHTHPGDENSVVLSGGPVRLPNGKDAVFADGTVLHFPEGAVHGGVTSTGDAPLVVMTTHVLRVGEPMTVPAE